MWKSKRLSGGAMLLVLCGLILAVILAVKKAGLSDWAAWVQALGSIGAIWWAYHSAEKQFERELDRRREDQDNQKEAARQEQSAQLEVIVAIAVDCMEALIEFQNYAHSHIDGKRFQLRTARLEDAQYALRGVMVRPMLSGTATPILDLQRSVSRTLRDADRYYGKSKRPDDDMQDVIYGRALRAMRDAEKISGFEDAWRTRQQESIWPAKLLSPPYRGDGIK
ncbi:hypothetical protein [Achromobacter arsenitoxydans]|nr:hypothetical protein [Achromobacter arsenitoxydans]